MICTNCAVEIPDGSQFCGNCGTSLALSCPTCGRDNPSENNFCANCGSSLTADDAPAPSPPSILDSPATDSGERRFVSVLFADLVGFTTFSEGRDPEDIRSMLTRYFDRAREVIERFGGEVDKFIGDAVTAFWGAKRALEDDAERAVRAGLELIDAVEALGAELGIPELAVRAGILSGEASVGSGGNQHGLVVGDIVNTASRLQSAADPGSVFVGETTQQLTDNAIRYESVGTQEMKGKSIPVAAWRALSVVGQRGGKGKWEILEPPFVGRDDELRLVKDQLHATTRDGTARLVSIVGEAGIGKSRLAWELLKYVDGITEAIRWHQGRSPAYGEAVTFWALTEMVRSRTGIADTDEPLKARTKLRTAVAEHVPDLEEQQWIEPRLAGLLGLDDMPEGNKDELYAALRGFFQHISEVATTVLLFEDVHWADDGLLEFIEELVEMSTGHPILVITLARPEILERHPGWGAARHHFLSMHLGPLSGAEMTGMISGMVPGIPEHTVSLIIERAGGVPLYAVEYVRMLVNGGDLVLDGSTYRQVGELAEVAMPDSLHALVGARLDRLGEESRSLIQDASVLGQSFTVEGMTVLTGASADDLEPKLRDLARHEMLRYDTNPRSPERGQFLENDHRDDGGGDGAFFEARTCRHSDGGNCPQAGGSGQTADGRPMAKDCAGSEEANTGHNLGSHSRRIVAFKPLCANESKQGSTKAHQHMGSQAGGLVPRFAFKPDETAQHGGNGQAERPFENRDVGWHWSSLPHALLSCRGTAGCRHTPVRSLAGPTACRVLDHVDV